MTGCCPRHPERARGFTLLEVLLVLAIVLALSAAAVPLLSHAADDAQLAQGESVLAGAVRAAQVESARRGEVIEIRMERDALILRTPREQDDAVDDEPIRAIDRFTLPRGVSVALDEGTLDAGADGLAEGGPIAVVTPDRRVSTRGPIVMRFERRVARLAVDRASGAVRRAGPAAEPEPSGSLAPEREPDEALLGEPL